MHDANDLTDLLAIIIIAAYSSSFSFSAAFSNLKEIMRNLSSYQRLGW